MRFNNVEAFGGFVFGVIFTLIALKLFGAI
jgi:hypothetical protein